MRILFIEDDRATQVSVGEWFRLIFKFEVVSAYNGQEALDILLRDTRFDIIILDCRMPIMDGEEFLEHYRGTIPVIYSTAFSSPSRINQRRSAAMLRTSDVAPEGQRIVSTSTLFASPRPKCWTSNDVDKYAIYTYPTGLAVTKVIAVVTGHVLGVVAAHDRAVRLLPRRHALVGQLPMLILMVAYTLTGLFLLFSS